MSKFRLRGRRRKNRPASPDRGPLRSIVPNLITSIAACAGITRDCFEAQKPVFTILDDAEKAVYNIAMRRGGDSLEHIHQTLIKAYAQIEELYVNKGRISGVPSGFT